MVLRNCFLGIKRFDDFQTNLGVTRHVLAERLQRLVDAEVLCKVAYQQKPERFEYRLTEKGRDLYPVLMALVGWGDKWLDEGRGAPLEYIHQPCGHKFRPVMVCSACGEALSPKQVMPVIGPGFLPAKTA